MSAIISQNKPETTAAFTCHGQAGAAGPIVLAVPHAGRAYSAELLASARVPIETLARLEDRFADRLTDRLVEAGHCVLIAHAPRAMIDLNRDEREVDITGIAGIPAMFPILATSKVRGGLGLIPQRLAQGGDLWRRPLAFADMRSRIATVHRPYHALLNDLLVQTRQRHGVALLIDLHSMPPLSAATGSAEPAPQLVIGDRFGRSAAPRLSAACLDVAQSENILAALNHPYPGSHILDRHGQPWSGIHALQLEVDRQLYLDEVLDQHGAGLGATQRLIERIVDALAAELVQWPNPSWSIAAE